jgi:hypothetical protein
MKQCSAPMWGSTRLAQPLLGTSLALLTNPASNSAQFQPVLSLETHCKTTQPTQENFVNTYPLFFDIIKWFCQGGTLLR